MRQKPKQLKKLGPGKKRDFKGFIIGENLKEGMSLVQAIKSWESQSPLK